MAKLFKKKINLGYKYDTECCKIEKKSINYPTFYVSKKKLSLTGEDVGKEFDSLVRLKLVGIREENRKGKESFNYDFEVQSITI